MGRPQRRAATQGGRVGNDKELGTIAGAMPRLSKTSVEDGQGGRFMNALNNLKTGVKLIGAFVVVAMIAGAIGFLGIRNIKAIDEADTQLYQNMTVPISELADMGVALQRIRVNFRDAILAENTSDLASYVTTVNSLTGELDKKTAEFEKTILKDNVRQAHAQFVKTWTEFKPMKDNIMSLASQGKDKEALVALRAATVTARAVEASLDNLQRLKVEAAKQTSDSNSAIADSAVTTMLTFLGFGVALALVAGVVISRSITVPLGKGVAMMQEMAKGHLGTRLRLGRRDEIGVLADAMDAFSDDLQLSVVGTMKKVAVGDLSGEVAPKDAQDEITPALKATIEALRGLVAEANLLSKAAVEGRLSTRGNAQKFQGGYHEIVTGVNDTLD